MPPSGFLSEDKDSTMNHRGIRKQPGPDAAFMRQDYDRIRTKFAWDKVRSQSAGLPGGGLNMG
ncbi:hypothetical protein ACFYXM_30530 [Streptomyces sp. NPDC002476]|uniref:hypothetical protein n=1 Tax=Streptomyces sp. NPDC002476 TaxID=3364648 RepID=UPI0036A9E0E5